MRSRSLWVAITMTCGLLGGLGQVYVGATSTKPYPWIHLVSGVLMLAYSLGMGFLWLKARRASGSARRHS